MGVREELMGSGKHCYHKIYRDVTEEFLKRALKKLCKYSLSKFFLMRMVSYLFFLWQDSSLLTAREEEILQVDMSG